MTDQLLLHPLRYFDEGERVTIGRVDGNSHAVFPQDGAALLRRLELGETPADAARWYAEQYGEPVDVDEFVGTLRDLSFVRSAADPVDGPVGADRPVRWQRTGTLLFSVPGRLVLGLLVAGAVVVCLADHRYLPRREHMFFCPYLTVIEISLFLGGIPLAMLHESFHFLAGRRLGLPASIGIGRRMYVLVAETRLDALVMVPRRQRFLPILAGPLSDVVVASTLTLIAWAVTGPDGSIPPAGRVCLAFAFIRLLSLAAQCYIFLRTDFYHLLTTVLRCTDLHGTTRGLIRNRWWRLLGRSGRVVPEERWDPRDRMLARWYGPVYLAGYAFMIAMLLLVGLPVTVQFLSTAGHALLLGNVATAHFWDAATFAAITAGQLAVAGWLAVRERLGKRGDRS